MPDKPLNGVKFVIPTSCAWASGWWRSGNPFSSRTERPASCRRAIAHQFGPLRQLHPDRRRHQPRQLGRAAVHLDGQVVGTIRRSSRRPGSIGTASSVPSKTAVAVVDQLRQFGETRRGWLGVKIQQVTTRSRDPEPQAGARRARRRRRRQGPAKPAGIEAGDVIVKFDGKDIKEMPRPGASSRYPGRQGVEVLSRAQGQGEVEWEDNAPVGQIVRTTSGRVGWSHWSAA